MLDDLFSAGVFQGSIVRVFARENEDPQSDLAMAFNSSLQVLTSRDFKVCGAIGAWEERRAQVDQITIMWGEVVAIEAERADPEFVHVINVAVRIEDRSAVLDKQKSNRMRPVKPKDLSPEMIPGFCIEWAGN